jgi:hypothetical protein
VKRNRKKIIFAYLPIQLFANATKKKSNEGGHCSIINIFRIFFYYHAKNPSIVSLTRKLYFLLVYKVLSVYLRVFVCVGRGKRQGGEP